MVVLEVEDQPYPFGHFFFKYVAPAEAMFSRRRPFFTTTFRPYLSAGPQIDAFRRSSFPDLFGLPKQFDLEHYARAGTDPATNSVGQLGS